MDILYILGNGFDLQLGLPTRYSDFYNYYSGLESKSDAIKKLKEDIKEKPKDWSDLEEALGKYTSQTKTIEEFAEIYDDIQTALRDYISKVDEMIESGEFSINASSETITKGFTYPEKKFDSDVTYTINGEYDNITDGISQGRAICNVNILTFNYTHLVEKYIKDILLSKKSTHPRYINSILHVHREIKGDQSIWIGVDNKEQISNESFRNDSIILYRLIKPQILSISSRRMLNDALGLIENANVFVIFGASLESSDMTWAKEIAKRIGEGAIVLLFVHNNKSYPTDNARIIDQEQYKKEFVEKMNGYGANIKEVSRIFVGINSSIFTDDTPDNHNNNLKLVLERLKENKENMLT